MDTATKIQHLEKQIEDAKDGDPADFSLWKQQVSVVLRNVLGEANPLCNHFATVKYSPMAWSTSTPQSAFVGIDTIPV